MLKFAGFANKGDMIKAFDFKPMADRPDCFMTGIVLDKGPIYVYVEELGREIYHCDGYTVRIVGSDEDSKERIGDIGYIPFEVSMFEYDERITMVATAAEVEMVMGA